MAFRTICRRVAERFGPDWPKYIATLKFPRRGVCSCAYLVIKINTEHWQYLFVEPLVVLATLRRDEFYIQAAPDYPYPGDSPKSYEHGTVTYMTFYKFVSFLSAVDHNTRKTWLSNLDPAKAAEVNEFLDSKKSFFSFKRSLQLHYDDIFQHSWNWKTQKFEKLEDRNDGIVKLFLNESLLCLDILTLKNQTEYLVKSEHNVYLFWS